MCGIHAVVSQTQPGPIEPQLLQRLRNRGPDHLGTVAVELERDDSTRVYVTLTSTVLSLRGDNLTEQPLVSNDTGAVLCWNGEAWSIGDTAVVGNDGVTVLNHLVHASRAGREAILSSIRDIQGPFSFVFFETKSKTLYFGRDRLGRRSLLRNTSEGFTLSSIAGQTAPSWEEVEADGFYSTNLASSEMIHSRHDWISDESHISGIGTFNSTVSSEPEVLSRESEALKLLRAHLSDSLHPRVLTVPVPPKTSTTDSRIAVLFSGGLDCTVLARMINDIVPPDQSIDLLNVAFENPRIAFHNKELDQAALYELCPDRITGRKSFAELIQACPDRRWRFVNINVPYTLTTAHRSDVINLIYPHNTEMDLSIAYALYFAAMGVGKAQMAVDAEPEDYSTTARVLLSGLGADELFGGYLRHETAFQRHGYPGLIDELKLDVSRLGKRNLGRDDRAMSNWGREVRFPYLDEAFVKWAIGTPVWQKCDFGNGEETTGVEPAKRLLRLLAQELRLPSVATEKKRAIQFGARTAKMENGKVKGTTLIS